MRAHTGKGPDYCDKIGRGPNWCLLGHVTGLFFCLYVKFVPTSICDSVIFGRSMSCILLDIELADRNVWEFSLIGIFRDTHLVIQKSANSQSKQFWCTRNMHGVMWNSGRLDYSERLHVLPRDVGVYFLQKEENCKFLASLLDKELENWMILAVSKSKISLMKKCGFARFTDSNKRPHITVQSARQNCLVTR